MTDKWQVVQMTSHKSRRYGATHWKVVDENGNNVCCYIENKKTAELIANAVALQSENTELKAKLDKAVEDIKANWMCRSCAKRIKGHEWTRCENLVTINGEENVLTCANFEWRGLEESE